MIQVTLTFTSICAAVDALSSLKAHGYAAPAVSVSHAPEPTGNATPAPTAAPVAAAPQADTSAPAASSTKPVESPVETPKADAQATALSYEKDVKPIVIKVGAAGKRDALVDLLKKFGVAKGPEVPADKLPAFKAELEALVA